MLELATPENMARWQQRGGGPFCSYRWRCRRFLLHQRQRRPRYSIDLLVQPHSCTMAASVRRWKTSPCW